MKTQLHKNLAISLLVGISLIACQPTGKKNTKNDIQFSSLETKETYHLMENPDNPNCSLQLSFSFPVKYEKNEILSKIQKLFISSYFGETYENYTPQEAIAHYTEDYLNAYKELEEDYRNDLANAENAPVGSWYSYYEMATNEVSFNMNDLISYTVNFENYTGGAHGAHSTTNHVINLKNGEFLKEEDIFISNFEDTLAQMLIKDIAIQNELDDPKELENIGYFSIDEIYPNGNFLVNEKGITYSFNEYEIAAYVVGITHVEFPYEKIRHLLRPESPISHLFNK